eukprot:g13236.t1
MRDEEDSDQILKNWEIKDIGFQATSKIQASETPLLTLMRLSQDAGGGRKKGQELRQMLRDGAEVFSMNGRLVRPDHSELSLFPLMETLHPFFVGVERLVRLGISERAACEVLKEVKGSGKVVLVSSGHRRDDAGRNDRPRSFPADLGGARTDGPTGRLDALVPGGFPGALPGIVPGLRKVLQAAPTEAPSLVPPPPPAPPNRALPSTKVDALASDAITTSSKPGMKISIDMTGFHMSAEEIRQSEDKLKQEKSWDNQGLHAEIREIAHRHEAYQWLKQHGNNMDNSVCEAAGTFFNFKVLTQLVKMGGSVNKQMCGSDSGTPLQAAAYWGLSEGPRRIMRELGADPNLCNAKGLPPVYEACEHVNGPSNKERDRG